MGHIKEPKGVDFIIKSRLLTKEEEIAISEFIHNCKNNPANKKTKATPPKKQHKVAHA